MESINALNDFEQHSFEQLGSAPVQYNFYASLLNTEENIPLRHKENYQVFVKQAQKQFL